MEENKEITKNAECEIYEFETTYEQMLEVHRYAYKEGIALSMAASIIFFVITLVSAIFVKSLSPIMLTGGVLFMAFSLALAHSTKNIAKKKYDESAGSLDKAVVYKDYIELHTYRNGEEVSMLRIEGKDVAAAVKAKKLCIFRKGIGYIGLPVEIIKEGTMLFDMLFKDGMVREADKAQNLTLLFKIFVIFSIAAPLVGVYASGNGEIKWWIFAICLAFPITAIVLGAVLISRGIKFKGRLLYNIIACVMAAFMLFITVLGTATSALNSLADFLDSIDSGYSESADSATTVARLREIGIDFLVEEMYTYEYKTFDEAADRYVDVVNTTVYIADIDAFCEAVEADERWQSTTESEVFDAFGAYLSVEKGDVWMLYNDSEGTYNTITATTPCDYVAVVFSSQYSYLDIYEFTK